MRVTNLSQSQFLVLEMQRAFEAEAKTSQQVSSGKKGDTYKDIGSQTSVLLSAKRTLDHMESYRQTSFETKTYLERQNLALTEMEGAARELREEILSAVATNKGTTLMSKTEAIFDRALAALNATHNGKYIFGGTRTDTEPVNIDDMNQLLAPASVANIFDNNQVKPSVTLEEGEAFTFGQLASDLGTGIMSAIKSIVDFNNTSGPIQGDLTPAQLTFLEGQLANLVTVAEGTTQQTALNGINQKRVDQIIDHIDRTKVTLDQFVSDVEDVNLAEAVSRLNQDQLALQAATRMVSQIGQFSCSISFNWLFFRSSSMPRACHRARLVLDPLTKWIMGHQICHWSNTREAPQT